MEKKKFGISAKFYSICVVSLSLRFHPKRWKRNRRVKFKEEDRKVRAKPTLPSWKER